jgi:hypothetical protein
VNTIPSSDANEPAIGPLLTVTDVAKVTLPLDAYYTSVQDRFVGYQAEDILVNKCMARKGFRSFRLGVPTTASLVMHRLFLPVNLSVVERYGFDLPPPIPAQQLQGDVPNHVPPLSAAGTKALLGTTKQINATQEPGGCMGEADAMLARGAPKSSVNLGQLDAWSAAASSSAMSDSRYIAAVKKWSECMADAGYHFSTPQKAFDAGVELKNSNGVASQAGITQAVTDVKCKASSRTADIGYTLMAAYEKQIIEANLDLSWLARPAAWGALVWVSGLLSLSG